MNYQNDKRIVLTLDAGGTNFVFVAMQGGKQIGESVRLPSEAKDLDKSIGNMKAGFRALIEKLDTKPSAISFAFPGPADYPNGIIYNVGNLPAFAGGVALADALQDEFNIPVFINNDGDLFVYGEAIAGFLPKINKALEDAGSVKRYKRLFGVTLGTGFGGGLVNNGELYIGDNSNGLEVWLMRNYTRPECFAEEGACIRAVQKAYARCVGLEDYTKFTPKDIEDIALGKLDGNPQAAKDAYAEMGQVLGEIFAAAATLFDSLIVIGGGLSYGHKLFMESAMNHLNGSIQSYDGKGIPRLTQKAFNLEDPSQFAQFLKGEQKEIKVYASNRSIIADPSKRIGIGITTLGTSEAVAVGAYAFALNEIDKRGHSVLS